MALCQPSQHSRTGHHACFLYSTAVVLRPDARLMLPFTELAMLAGSTPHLHAGCATTLSHVGWTRQRVQPAVASQTWHQRPMRNQDVGASQAAQETAKGKEARGGQVPRPEG